MPDRRPEGFDRMAGKVAARHIGDSHRDHQGDIAAAGVGGLLRRHCGTFGVQCIKYCFNQQEIDTAFNQGIALLAIDIFQIVEINLPKSGVINIGRQR